MTEAGAVIVAAIIAGWVSFFSLIISKEQSVSEFRQQWIDELRKDIAAVVASVTGIQGSSIAGLREALSGHQWATLREDLIHFREVVTRIRLRLNPNENGKNEGPATRAALGTLTTIENIFGSEEPQFDELHPLLTQLVTHSQVILKENWNRVRRGELTYRVTKWLTLAVVVAVAASIAWLAARYGFKF